MGQCGRRSDVSRSAEERKEEKRKEEWGKSYSGDLIKIVLCIVINGLGVYIGY